MARASIEIVTLLRQTANRLRQSSDYQWGHMGLCNCGFLAQAVTHLRKDEIHARAMMSHGDWNEQLNDYCPTSGLPMDDLISELLAVGFDIDDLKHLERLSSPAILASIGRRHLVRNHKDDVILYLETWSQVLESKLLKDINIEPVVFREETLNPTEA